MPAAEPIAVTGAGGYLGGRLVGLLGPDARALVRSPVPWLPASQQVPCDLLGGLADVERALAGTKTIVHLAGHNEVVAAEDPDRAVGETVAMAEGLLKAARASGVERIVYVSTIHVYGAGLQPGAHLDEDAPAVPTSAYAAARRRCEELLTGDGGAEVVVLRLSNAVGAPAHPSVDRWTLVASDLCRGAVLDRTVRLRSTGQQWRDFIVLDDACRLVAGCTDPAVSAGTYNLASGRSATVRSLAQLVQDRVEARCGWRPALVGPEPDGPPDEPYVLDPGRLAAQGLRAEAPLEAGVDEIIDHCREHEAALRGRVGR